jgi:hypothetical protein
MSIKCTFTVCIDCSFMRDLKISSFDWTDVVISSGTKAASPCGMLVNGSWVFREVRRLVNVEV